MCENAKLLDLLIVIHKIKPVEYSVQKQKTLWDAGDRVEERRRCFYVTLRHFSGEIIGRHVAHICDIEKLEDERGERRTYRLPVATRQDEHLVVYVYNPAVCENGTLPIQISTVSLNTADVTTDHQNATSQPSFCVAVEPNKCQTVLKFDCQNMQTGHVTRLLNTDDNYLVELRIFLLK